MSCVIIYNTDDFEKISYSGFQYRIPDETLNMISALAEQVGAPTYVRTPVFQKRGGGEGEEGGGDQIIERSLMRSCRRRRNRGQEINDEDWEAIRNFQATEIEKKEGVEKSLDDIRKHLNKITDLTYIEHRDGIINLITEMVDIPLTDQNKIGEAIFNIASGNAFYSGVYAKLYKALMDKFQFMKGIFEINFKEFEDLFNSIEYFDPAINYDKFCNYNKQNDKRRSLSAFYINLMKEDVLEEDRLFDIIENLQKRILEFINQDNKREVVEEFSENIFIMTTNGYERLSEDDRWCDIYKIVENIANMTVKAHPSLSNKTLFKHLDMLDKFN